jgi:hypothetical protein
MKQQSRSDFNALLQVLLPGGFTSPAGYPILQAAALHLATEQHSVPNAPNKHLCGLTLHGRLKRC